MLTAIKNEIAKFITYCANNNIDKSALLKEVNYLTGNVTDEKGAQFIKETLCAKMIMLTWDLDQEAQDAFLLSFGDAIKKDKLFN
jgi:hypothetical protein